MRRLYCPRCDEDALHDVVHVYGGLLDEMRMQCLQCGRIYTKELDNDPDTHVR